MKQIAIKMSDHEHATIKRAAQERPRQSLNKFIIDAAIKAAAKKIARP